MNEVLLMIQGYRLRTRELQYLAYQITTPAEKQVPIWEFMWLEGDPNKQEIEQMKQQEIEENEKLVREAEEWYKQNPNWFKAN